MDLEELINWGYEWNESCWISHRASDGLSNTIMDSVVCIDLHLKKFEESLKDTIEKLIDDRLRSHEELVTRLKNEGEQLRTRGEPMENYPIADNLMRSHEELITRLKMMTRVNS